MKKRPSAAERDALRAFFELVRLEPELVRLEPGAPLLQEHLAAIVHVAAIVRDVCRLALSRDIPAKEAAARAAAVAGLTGRAIADFRAEQRALQTEMIFRFNQGQPTLGKSTVAAGSVGSVGERQVYRRLRRVR